MYYHPDLPPPKLKRSLPRLSGTTLLTIGLLLALYLVAPHQLPVVLYKCALVTAGALMGYWLDRVVFPYARPHALQGGDHWRSNLAMLRRAIIILACVLGLTLGL